VGDVPLDAQERLELCGLFDELGPSIPTLLDGWTAHDLAAHLVLREHDLVAGPCMVLPGPFERFAERRRAGVREMANLNEFFVHHEDVRRANGLGVRSLGPAMDAGL
jgi:hypothetical protein